MKQYRLEFSHGINIVSDKASLQPGWVTLADGVDLRSLQIRLFRGHSFVATTNTTATCIFSYRDSQYVSDEWRDYITETSNSQDRLYFTRYGLSPQKTIEGDTVDLGVEAPRSSPIASNSKVQGISLTVTQSTTGGIFTTGTYRSYRVAARTSKGVQVPCYAKIITFSNSTTISSHSAILSWKSVKDALGYSVFAGSSGNEKLALEVGEAVLSVSDDGSWPSGEDVKNYDDNKTYTYFYTFERDFKGQLDESGPSPVSQPIQTTYGRQLLFNPLSDGYFDQSTAQTITGPFTVSLSTTAPSSALTTVTVNKLSQVTLLVLSSSIGARTNDTVVFINGSSVSDPYLITVGTDGLHLQVNGDLDWLDNTYTIQQLKTYAEWTPGAETAISDLDVVYVTSTTSGGTQTGTFQARIETPATPGNIAISFPFHSQAGTSYAITSIKYIPLNGYIKYRNLYRTAPAGGWALVEKIPIWQTEYTDTTSAQNLGAVPLSYYTENGIQVIYAKPPIGLQALTSHYGMAFAIDGIRVRWTPIGNYDAWPEAFYQEFPSNPVALASFAGALIVLCEDRPYRLDGTQPTAMAINGTKAIDGCLAPYSVQATTDIGLLYLSKRGIMAFDGMNATCLTDQCIPARFWQAPSFLANDATAYCLLPTMMSHNYAALAYEDGIRSDITVGYAQHLNNPAAGIIRDIRSFLWNGKYFLYWGNQSGNFGAHTTICLDLKREGRPITTLPYRLKAACTNENGRVFAILRDVITGSTTVTITHEVAP